MSAITTSLEHVIKLLSDSGVTASVQNRVFQGAIPNGSKYPALLIQSYGETSDFLGIGKESAGSRVDLLVRVIAPSDSLVGIESIHNATMRALHGTSGLNERGNVASCVRVSESEMTEVEDVGVTRYLGSRYRLLINEQLA